STIVRGDLLSRHAAPALLGAGSGNNRGAGIGVLARRIADGAVVRSASLAAHSGFRGRCRVPNGPSERRIAATAGAPDGEVGAASIRYCLLHLWTDGRAAAAEGRCSGANSLLFQLGRFGSHQADVFLAEIPYAAWDRGGRGRRVVLRNIGRKTGADGDSGRGETTGRPQRRPVSHMRQRHDAGRTRSSRRRLAEFAVVAAAAVREPGRVAQHGGHSLAAAE